MEGEPDQFFPDSDSEEGASEAAIEDVFPPFLPGPEEVGASAAAIQPGLYPEYDTQVGASADPDYYEPIFDFDAEVLAAMGGVNPYDVNSADDLLVVIDGVSQTQVDSANDLLAVIEGVSQTQVDSDDDVLAAIDGVSQTQVDSDDDLFAAIDSASQTQASNNIDNKAKLDLGGIECWLSAWANTAELEESSSDLGEGAPAAAIPSELEESSSDLGEGATAAAIPSEPTNAADDVDNTPLHGIAGWETPVFSNSPPDLLDCGAGYANSFKIPFYWEGMRGISLATLKSPVLAVDPPTEDVDNPTKMLDSSSNEQQNNTGSVEDMPPFPSPGMQHHRSTDPAHASKESPQYDNGKRTDSVRGSPNELHSGSPSGFCSGHAAGGPVFRAIRGRQCPGSPSGPSTAFPNLPPPGGVRCHLCARLGEPPSWYNSHKLSESGIVTCPRLKNFVCPHCGAKGCIHHAGIYCPLTGQMNWQYEE